MLEVEALQTYYGPSHILQGVSLRVERGEVVCLLGRNGAGKTTTLRSIMGLARPRAGRIRFLGEDVTGHPPHRLAALGIAYVPQDGASFRQLSVEENLTVVPVRRPAEPGRSLDRIWELFPELGRLGRRRAGSLSGGEQKMLAIARALMLGPSLILLDEPSQSLAPQVVRRLVELVGQIARSGVAILLAEQNVRVAQELASRGYILDKGRVRREGAVAELLGDAEIVQKHLTL